MNYQELRLAIGAMSPRSKLYKVLKEELTARGYWQNKPRGNPSKGYQAMKSKKVD